MIKVFLFSLCLLLTSITYAQDAKLMIKQGKGFRPVNWSMDVDEKWEENSDKVPVLIQAVSINMPSGQEAVKSKTKRKNKVAIENGGRTLKVSMASESDLILVQTKRGRLILKLDVAWKKNLIGNEGCEEKKIFLEKVSEGDIPFRIDIKCYKRENQEFLVVTVPKEVRWSSTTVPEYQGKGEHWKEYRLEDLPSGEGNIRGQISFRYQKKSYQFQLKSVPPEVQKVIRDGKTTNFYIGGGLMNLSIKSDISSAQESPINLAATVETFTPWWNLRAGISLLLPQNLGGGATDATAVKPLQFFEGRVFLAKDFTVSPSLKAYPMLVGIFSESSDPNVLLTISHQHIGFGGGVFYTINPKWSAQLDFWMSGFLSSIPTSHFGMLTRINWQLWETIGVGIELGTQAITVEGATGTKNEMGETHYGIFMKF